MLHYVCQAKLTRSPRPAPLSHPPNVNKLIVFKRQAMPLRSVLVPVLLKVLKLSQRTVSGVTSLLPSLSLILMSDALRFPTRILQRAGETDSKVVSACIHVCRFQEMLTMTQWGNHGAISRVPHGQVLQLCCIRVGSAGFLSADTLHCLSSC